MSTNPSTIRVKFAVPGQHSASPAHWLRQFPSRNPVWGNCQFLFDPEETEYDWFVAYNGLPLRDPAKRSSAVELLTCPKEHTLFITMEPSSVNTYGSIFLRQFTYVLTGQEDWAIKHPGKIYSQPALHWYYGYNEIRGQEDRLIDYDQMLRHAPETKTKILSTVCSTKAQKHTAHYKRVKFIEFLCEALPELDRFGKGVREIDDKSSALDAYKYHIAIENHISEHWWTEKLSDAFLGLTLPFYHGASNADEYFPEGSYIPIDINDYEGSLHTIRRAVENGEYEKRLKLIREARTRVLEKYNTFSTLSSIIEARHDPDRKVTPGFRIKGRYALRRNPVTALQVGLEKAWMRGQTIIRKI